MRWFCPRGREGKNPDSLSWFGGKTVVVEGLSHSRLALEKGKEEQNLNFDTGYVNHEKALPMAGWNGTDEAAFLIKRTPFMAMKNLGMKLDVYDPHWGTMPDAYAFRRTDEVKAKREAPPKTIQEMHGDGTLKELSTKWFGVDFTDPSGL